MKLICRGSVIDLSEPCLMGIINLTPDSFSGDGLAARTDPTTAAVQQAQAMVTEGARIIDLGAVSTRPGALPVEAAVETERLLEPFRAVVRATDALYSIDTTSHAVARRMGACGAHIINDVSGLADHRMMEAVLEYSTAFVITHSSPERRYHNIVSEVAAFWHESCAHCLREGIDIDQLVFDPGIGFHKSRGENLLLLRQLERLVAVIDRPVLVGASRKTMLGHITGRATAAERDAATAGTTALAVAAGAKIIRVHNIAPNYDALRVAQAIAEA